VLVCFLSCGKTRLIVDWHNYGFSILQVGGTGKAIVGLARWYELFFGKMAWKHLTVSEAMKQNLVQLIRVDPKLVHVVYDRATNKFKSLNQDEKQALFVKIGLPQLCKPDRPALLLSSTSYTPDEDFMILVKALDLVDQDASSPHIQVLVTGRGP
jgi:beta-1,4-mannosyltransferase